MRKNLLQTWKIEKHVAVLWLVRNSQKVAAWLYTIQHFAQRDSIFSLAALDQHLAVSSSLIASTQTERVVTATVATSGVTGVISY